MAADPQRVADTRDWRAKAQHDQAAEKSLKAFLYWHDVPFRKTHELEELGREAIEIDSALARSLHEAVLERLPAEVRPDA